MEVKPNTIWRHKKTGVTYYVTDIGEFMCSQNKSLDRLAVVIYERAGRDDQYVRPYDEFTERFDYTGDL